MSGAGAAALFKFLPSRRDLLHAGLSGGQLAAAQEALDGMRDAAIAWRDEMTSAGSGGAAGQRRSETAESRSWMTTSEAATVLRRSERRVREYVSEGVLQAVSREGGRLLLDAEQVLALHKRRSEMEGLRCE